MTPEPGRFESVGEPSVTVIMRSRNDVDIIGRTLDGLLSQGRRDFRLLALDNDSTDGTVDEYLRRGVQPERVPSGDYNPGRVLNAGVARADSRWVVFLNSDCVPVHPELLEELLRPLEEGRADAVYGRQVPRRGASALVVRDHAKAFGPQPAAFGRLFFSLAVSAFPRALLLERPLPEHVQYSEDLAWAVAARAAGARIVYAPAAVVEHSHEYSVPETARRFFEEGRADAVIFAGGGRPVRPARQVVGWAKDVLLDTGAAVRAADWSTLARGPAVRAAQRFGYVAGRWVGPRRELSA